MNSKIGTAPVDMYSAKLKLALDAKERRLYKVKDGDDTVYQRDAALKLGVDLERIKR